MMRRREFMLGLGARPRRGRSRRARSSRQCRPWASSPAGRPKPPCAKLLHSAKVDGQSKRPRGKGCSPKPDSTPARLKRVAYGYV
jgi:hypothetical protein